MEWFKLLEYSVGSLSILGTFFVIFIFLSYKELRSFAFEQVTYLTTSSMLTTISYLIYFIKDEKQEINHTLCNWQATLIVGFELGQYIWACLIAISVYNSVIHFENNRAKTSCKKRFFYLFISYVLPFLLSLLFLVKGEYGPTGTWCWVDEKKKTSEKTIVAIIIYFIYWLLILTNLTLNLNVIRFLNKEFSNKEEREFVKIYIWKLFRYPLIQIICIVPGSIYRFLIIVFDTDVFFLQVTHVVFTMLQGLLYALAYGYTSQVKTALQDSLGYYLYCCFTQRRDSETTDRDGKQEDYNTSLSLASKKSLIPQNEF